MATHDDISVPAPRPPVLSRRAAMRHMARLGLLPLAAAAPARPGRPGAVIRIACDTPEGAIDPVTVSQAGGLLMLMQTGEFLLRSGPDLVLRPMLATAWAPNADGSAWTFQLRRGVRFHDGSTLSARDVAASFAALCDPASGSNALSALRGVLSPGGIGIIDDVTIRFTLDAPNGNFPYYVSSDNYNAIIRPHGETAPFSRHFTGTGPFRLGAYMPKRGAVFLRNDAYWGAAALPARLEFSFFESAPAQILALQDRQVDVISGAPAQGARALLHDPAVSMMRLRSANCRQLHMRTDRGAFADARVRRAVALSLDRPGIVQGLFAGFADLGNDSPFAPVYPSTAADVPQRARDLPQARALLRAAGAHGLRATLVTERLQEMPDLAVVIQSACAEIGITLDLRIEDPGIYYGTAHPGSSDWLDSTMGLTDYGHRAVPNVLLAAPLLSGGAWNAAHFRNAEYDRLVARYVAALTPAAQHEAAGEIERLLLRETPVIIPYFSDYLVPVSARLRGVQPTAIGQLFLQDAWFA